MKKYKDLDDFKNNFEKDLKNDIDSYLWTYAKTYCDKAAEELTETAKYAIEQFYEDYNEDEKYYKRTNNLKNNSYKLYFHNNGTKLYGGVKISADDMDTYYKREHGEKVERDPFLVLESAWEGGWHGIYGMHYEEGKTGVIPMKIVDDKMKDKKFLDDLHKTAIKAAKQEKYELIEDYIKNLK